MLDIQPGEKWIILPHQVEAVKELETLIGYWPVREVFAAQPGYVRAEIISNDRTALLRSELGHVLITIVEW